MFKNFNWKLSLRLGISMILMGWFVFSINWTEIGRAFAVVSYPWLLAAVFWIVIAVVVSVHKWRLILRAQGMRLEWGELWSIYWAGLFFNNFLPSGIGGDGMRIIWVRKITGDGPGAAASVVTERILAAAGLALVGLSACLLKANPSPEITALFALLLLVSLVVVVFMMYGRLPGFVTNKDSKMARFITLFSGHGKLLAEHPGTVISVILWSAVFQLCVVGVNHCIFNGLHIGHVGWLEAMYVIPAVSAAAMLPLGINGYGIREGAYITLLAATGVPAALSFAASVMFAFLVSIFSLWGGWVWLRGREKGAYRDVGIEGL
ncbi:MAG: hypothetical protein CVV03_05510 [Firmicutes bacterium HGW-Firmicutes-8]|nr:MAG: hypothetical protein CVV03_05510 [Firmicutes bacterium HGW-Firmicutes-8]